MISTDGDAFFATLAREGTFSEIHPAVAAFLKDYLEHEKVVDFDGRSVINTHFPPYPSVAFDRFCERLSNPDAAKKHRLYSVTIAITNRCPFRCWHCYNAGRSQADTPLDALARLAEDLGRLGAVVVTLTGGEPTLRADLPEIVSLFDERFCVTLGTTGHGLTPALAANLADRGLFAVGISLDATEAAEHDRLRGKEGAFESALLGLRTAGEAGLYPYAVSVGRREFIQRERLLEFLSFAASKGAREVHLLEPFATGRLEGRTDVLLTPTERESLVNMQKEVCKRNDLPILSSFAYLESAATFGCGAGTSHLYVDGSGEVYPCQQVPTSFGNLSRDSFPTILDRMGEHFTRPRADCIAHRFACKEPTTDPAQSAETCASCLREDDPSPRYHEVLLAAHETVDDADVRRAYAEVGEVYDDFWVVEAGRPVEILVDQIEWDGVRRIFEAGCGTGFGTELLLSRMEPGADLLAVDLTKEMLAGAERRVQERARFRVGDALALLAKESDLDLVFTSWVLGYIPLAPFFETAARSLRSGGRLAFVVHVQDSPREAVEIFNELVAEDPSALLKRVWFDFPRNLGHAEAELRKAGFRLEWSRSGSAAFRYRAAEEVLEHLLKSGAGTTFYNALDPAKRDRLETGFVRALKMRHPGADSLEVVHDYIACVATAL